MDGGDDKGIRSRHMLFGSIASLGKCHNRLCTLWLHHRKIYMVKNLVGHKQCVKHLISNILLKMTQIVKKKNCVTMLLDNFKVLAHHVHYTAGIKN